MKTLIIEDDYLSRSLLSTMLSEYGVCHLAENGQEGLTMMTEALKAGDPYDLICLDIMMPVLDGQKTLTAIRKVEKEDGVEQDKRVAVVMITAIDDKDNILRAFQKGECEAYITKPVDREKLIGHIKQLGLINREGS